MNKTLIEVYQESRGLLGDWKIDIGIDKVLATIESRLSALEGAHNLVAAQVLSDIKKGLPENVGLANEADMFVKSALEHPEPDNGTTVNKAHDEGVIYGLNLAKSMAENLKRLNVGSIPDRLLTDIEAMKQDFQCNAKPAETEKEWIKWNDPVWCFWDTGEITLEKALDLGRCPNVTHIMPYHPGDPKPEAPKGDK